GFHPDFSGRENAYLNGSLLGLSRREMDTVMPGIQDFADIGRFFDAPVKTYSSGMYARLGFAVAIHVEPDVLLVDEVLAVGDEYFQHKCFAKINAFRAGGETVTIELSYRARRAIDEVTFGVAFYRDDGLACYGSNTTLDGVHVAVRAGEGIVRFHAPRFELLEGQYTLDVAAVSPDYADTYDFHSKAYPFRTYGASGEIGVVRIAHGWVHEPGVTR